MFGYCSIVESLNRMKILLIILQIICTVGFRLLQSNGGRREDENISKTEEVVIKVSSKTQENESKYISRSPDTSVQVVEKEWISSKNYNSEIISSIGNNREITGNRNFDLPIPYNGIILSEHLRGKNNISILNKLETRTNIVTANLPALIYGMSFTNISMANMHTQMLPDRRVIQVSTLNAFQQVESQLSLPEIINGTIFIDLNKSSRKIENELSLRNTLNVTHAFSSNRFERLEITKENDIDSFDDFGVTLSDDEMTTTSHDEQSDGFSNGLKRNETAMKKARELSDGDTPIVPMVYQRIVIPMIDIVGDTDNIQFPRELPILVDFPSIFGVHSRFKRQDKKQKKVFKNMIPVVFERFFVLEIDEKETLEEYFTSFFGPGYIPKQFLRKESWPAPRTRRPTPTPKTASTTTPTTTTKSTTPTPKTKSTTSTPTTTTTFKSTSTTEPITTYAPFEIERPAVTEPIESRYD